MALDKFAGLFASSAQSMASSARSIEQYAEMLESQLETQNALLTTLIDKIGNGGAAKAAAGGAGKGGKLTGLIGGLAADGAEAADGMAKFGGAAPIFAKGLKVLSNAMKFWETIPEDTVTRFTDSLDKLAKKFADMNFQAMATGALAIREMSKSIAIFGLTLLVASAAYAIIGPMAMLTVIPVIAGFAYVFYKVGEAGDSIERGAKAIAWMSLSIVGMGLAMMLTMQLAGGSWGAFVKGALVITAGIAIFGLTFHIIGLMENEIEEGTKAVAWMGLAIISLAVGLGVWQMFGIDFQSILYTAAGVLLIGTAFGIIGIFDKYIEQGALAMLFTGVAIGILAIGIGAFKLFGIGWEDLALVGAAVIGTGLLFAGAGFLAPFIAAGALAIMAAGASMIVLSVGVLALNATYKKAMDGLFAIGSDGSGRTNMSIMIDSIVDAFAINPLKSIAMLAGGVALLFVSIAMVTLAGGIWAMSKHIGSELFNPAVGFVGGEVYKGTQLGLMIESIVDAFSINPLKSVAMLVGSVAMITASVAMLIMAPGLWALGKHADSPLFLPSRFDPKQTTLGVMFGSIVDSMSLNLLDVAALYFSMPAWLMVGKSMRDIGRGVADFVKIYEAGIDPGILSDALRTVLTGIVTAITSADENTDWDAVEDGLDAISDVGESITGIAEGVQAFADLKFPVYNDKGVVTKYLTLNDGVFKNVAINMKMMIGAVAGVLTDIGKAQGEVGWFSASAGEKGAEIIRGVGGDLVGIADFVVKAADLRIPKYDANGKLIEGETVKLTSKDLGPGGTAAMNIQHMIMAITNALGIIGKNPDADSGFWAGESNIQKGKEAVMGVGRDLKELSEVVVNMAQIEDMAPIALKIKQMLMIVPGIILKVAPAYEKTKDAQQKVFHQLKMINEPLTDMLEFLEKASKSGDDGTVGTKIGKSIASLFTELGKAVTSDNLTVNKMQPILDFVSNMAEHADPIEQLADSFEKLADNMDSFVKAYKGMDKKSMDKHKLLIDSLVVFSEVDPNALRAVSNHGQQLLDNINSGGPQSAPTTKAIKDAPSANTKQKGTKVLDGKGDKKTVNKIDTQAMEDTLAEIKAQLVQLNVKLGGTLKIRDVDGGGF